MFIQMSHRIQVLTKYLLGSQVKFAWIYVKVADAVSTPTNVQLFTWIPQDIPKVSAGFM